MGKTLFGGVVGSTKAVDVMSNLVNKNLVEVKRANGVDIVVAQIERMCAEKDAVAPVDAVAAERTRPRSLLLAGAGEEKDTTKTDEMLRRDPTEALLDVGALRRVDEVWSERRQGDETREGGLRR